MAGTFNKFNILTEDLAEKVHNFDTDTLKIVLTNTAPTATNTVLSDITQISGSGYTTDGYDTQNSTSRSSGTTSVVGVDVTVTASGGTLGPFRYVVLNNSTANKLIGYWDYGVEYSLGDGISFTVDFGSSMFTIT